MWTSRSINRSIKGVQLHNIFGGIEMQLERFNGHIEEADFLSMLMVDIAGNIRSVALPRGYVSEKVLAEGVGFDASNYGYAKVNNSDMVAIPDMETAFYEIRGDYKILHVFCDVVSFCQTSFKYIIVIQ